MEPKEWKMHSKPIDGMSDPVVAFPYPVRYGGTIPDDAKFGEEDENIQAFGIDVSQ